MDLIRLNTNPFYVKHGKVKHVKNLGWVIKYARNYSIDKIIARQENGVAHDAILEVYFKNGVKYESEFASYRVMCQWLSERHSWRGSMVHYYMFGQHTSKRCL